MYAARLVDKPIESWKWKDRVPSGLSGMQFYAIELHHQKIAQFADKGSLSYHIPRFGRAVRAEDETYAKCSSITCGRKFICGK